MICDDNPLDFWSDGHHRRDVVELAECVHSLKQHHVLNTAVDDNGVHVVG